VYLSQRLCAGTADHSALMWTPEKLAAAHEHRGAILAEFRRLADSRDVRKIGAFIYGDRPLRAVSGAPDRCAYYVGWLAVARWHDQHPERPLADLLKVPPAEIFAALVE
jgi:hypothetical protein